MNKYLTAILLLAISLTGCQSNGNEKGTPHRVKVELMTVTTGTNRTAVRYSGTAETESGAVLSFPIPGTIRTLSIHLGQRIVAGQQLATLDPTAMQSAYQAAKASLEQAEDAYKRMKALHAKGCLPEIKWVEVQSQLQQARSMENLAAKNLRDCELHAPFDGIIAEKSIEVGQNVMPGTPVARLVTDAQLNIRIAVPETEIADISIHQHAHIRIPALGDRTLDGIVVEKGIVANPLSRSYEVKIRVEDKHSELMPGMVAEVCLPPTNQDATSPCIIPAHLIQLDEHNNSFVWIVKDGQASKRIVRCGAFTSEGVNIISGLAAGESIITKGQQKVCEGTEVAL